jgi:hypothetical protein
MVGGQEKFSIPCGQPQTPRRFIFSHLTSQRSEQQYFSLPFSRRRIMAPFCRFSPQHAHVTCSMNLPPIFRLSVPQNSLARRPGIATLHVDVFLPTFWARDDKSWAGPAVRFLLIGGCEPVSGLFPAGGFLARLMPKKTGTAGKEKRWRPDHMESGRSCCRP